MWTNKSVSMGAALIVGAATGYGVYRLTGKSTEKRRTGTTNEKSEIRRANKSVDGNMENSLAQTLSLRIQPPRTTVWDTDWDL